MRYGREPSSSSISSDIMNPPPTGSYQSPRINVLHPGAGYHNTPPARRIPPPPDAYPSSVQNGHPGNSVRLPLNRLPNEKNTARGADSVNRHGSPYYPLALAAPTPPLLPRCITIVGEKRASRSRLSNSACAFHQNRSPVLNGSPSP